MNKYRYAGTDAFGEDDGTLTYPGSTPEQAIRVAGMPDSEVVQVVQKCVRDLPVVWFVDDERANRGWFRDHHSDTFAVLTFSSRRSFARCLTRSIPCDAIVTDLFFPAETVTGDGQAERLLSIYERISETRVDKLHELWRAEQHLWSLDGFDIAHDAAHRSPPVPVFLFSRKAALLLNVEDFPDEPSSVANSYWLVEKVDPTSTPERSKRAAQLQWNRILSVLGIRRRRFRALLDSLSDSTGGTPVDLKELPGD